MDDARLDPDALDGTDPFEIERQAAHLFKHPHLAIADVYDMWASDPLFYPAKPPAHWLMVAEVAGRVLIVPLAPARSGTPDPVPPNRLLCGQRRRCPSIQEGPMSTTKPMTVDEEYEFYARAENQAPQGPPVHRRGRLSEMVPVRAVHP